MTLSVLVADDSPTIRRRAATTLGEAGFEVHGVEDGDAAWQRLQDDAPDIVLCDILMPKVDGYELCRRIKADERLGRVPVMLLRGTFEPWDESRAMDAGADGFITKPFEPENLVATVREILESSDDEEEAEGSGAPAPAAEQEQGADDGDATVLVPAAGAEPSERETGAAEPSQRPQAADDDPTVTAEATAASEADEETADVPAARPKAESGTGAAAEPEPGSAFVPPPPEDSSEGSDEEAPPPLASDETSGGAPLGGEPDRSEGPETGEAPLGEPASPTPEPPPAATSKPAAAAPSSGGGDPFGEEDPFSLGDDEESSTPAAPAPAPSPSRGSQSAGGSVDLSSLDDATLDRLATKVAEKLAGDALERIAWDVVPDVAEALVRKRMLEIESKLQGG